MKAETPALHQTRDYPTPVFESLSTLSPFSSSSFKHTVYESPSIAQQRASSPLIASSNRFVTPPTPFLWKSGSTRHQLTHTNRSETSPSTPSKQSIYAKDTITPNRLFGSRHEANLGPVDSPPPRRPHVSPQGLGYFAFPPTVRQTFPVEHTVISEEHPPRSQSDTREDEPNLEEERNEEFKRKEAEDDARQLQIEAEAKRGEEAWVRSGGVLRDARGRRDVQRTEAVRVELKLRDWEAQVSARWRGYEESWRSLLADGGDDQKATERMFAFRDIPWPVHITVEEKDGQQVKLEDLTSDRVEAFFLEPLKVRGCTVAKKERVRSALLRWHPDKMTGVLRRVVAEDVEDVRAGIRVVVECLQRLNTNA